MSHYRIVGQVTTTAPLHISRAGEQKVDINGHYKSTGFPLTGVQVMRYYTPDGQRVMDPVIPANSLRGAIRRAAANHLQQALIAGGERMDWRLYNAVRVGTPHGKLSTMAPTAEEHRRASRHVYAGLMGGGQAMYRSTLVTNTAFPICAETIDAGLIPPELATYPEQEQESPSPKAPRFCERLFYRRTDDLQRLTDPNLERLLADWMQQIEEYQALTGRQVESEAQEGEEAGEGDGKAYLRGLTTFAALEVVRPGVPFAVEFEVTGDDEPTQAKVGLLIKALADMANSRMGGWTRNGFGRSQWQLSLTTPEDEHADILTRFEGRHEVNTNNELVARLVDAADDALEQVSAAELEAIFLNGKDENLAKARKNLAEAAAAEES